MELKQLVLQNRSRRRFFEDRKIQAETLRELVELARLTPSGANLQTLCYYISGSESLNNEIFETLQWAGYLKEWKGPEPGERPPAYIIITANTEIGTPTCEHGIAAQTILLGAVEKRLGGCIIANFQKSRLRKILNLHEKYEILLILALGEPKEEVVIEPMSDASEVKYWRDDNQVHHVPKRALKDIIIS